MNEDEQQLLAAARLAASRAAEFLRRQEGTLAPEAWSEKGKADFVTEVDREAERLIAQTLLAAVPDSVVVGEELSPHAPTPDPRSPTPGLTWIVDPLDGTTNFLHRFPYYSVSIAAVRSGEPVVGVVHHVPPDVVYHAVRGQGAFQDGRRLSVSRVVEPRHALVGTGFPFKYPHLVAAYQRQFAAVLTATSGIRRAGSAALDLCDVAAGRFDGFWELMLAPWDTAAGALMVREAGGRITGLDGEPDVIRHGAIVAGNAAVHGWLLSVLREGSGVGGQGSGA